MLRFTRFTTIALLLAAVLALAACSQTGGGSEEPVSNEDPVPEGMPVMYEFYTDT
jgi:ABC-type glycerol-3-phosphate transport system substrate-binding protein